VPVPGEVAVMRDVGQRAVLPRLERTGTRQVSGLA
jgi:hypothetical protein